MANTIEIKAPFGIALVSFLNLCDLKGILDSTLAIIDARVHKIILPNG